MYRVYVLVKNGSVIKLGDNFHSVIVTLESITMGQVLDIERELSEKFGGIGTVKFTIRGGHEDAVLDKYEISRGEIYE